MPQSSHSPRRKSQEKRRESFATEQQELFAAITELSKLESPNAPDLDVGPELQGAIHHAIRAAKGVGLSRERIVDRMNLALPEMAKPITKRQLDAWTAESKEHHEFPLRYIAAFCWATGSDSPLREIAGALGFELVDAREAATKRLGEAHLTIAGLRKEMQAITKTLGG